MTIWMTSYYSRMMMILICKESKGTMQVDVHDEGVMYMIDGEELTPLEVTKLALYYSLNWDAVNDERHEA